MTDLVERYIHQVGWYLPPRERAEIEAELRASIQDQLDDRFGPAPSPADVAAVLAEFGAPYQMAASYNKEQYLVGPDLYPYMMAVLRHGWLMVPAIVLFLSIFSALAASEAKTAYNLLIDPVIATAQVTFAFTGVVVLLFALLERADLELDAMAEGAFDPLGLPEVNHPSTVDRFEAVSGVVLGIFMTLVFLFWLRVGGLTLHFNLENPGTVIAVPAAWMFLLIIDGIGQVFVHLIVLRRNRWGVGTWLAQTLLELFGTVCLYFAVTRPFFDHIISDNPDLGNIVVINQAPEIIAIGYAVIMLINRGITLVRLWNDHKASALPFAVQTDR